MKRQNPKLPISHFGEEQPIRAEDVPNLQ